MRTLSLFFLLFFGFSLYSQTDQATPASRGELFEQVKSLADSGDLEEARLLASTVLLDQPDFSDLKVLLAMIHGREGNVEQGIVLLREVLEKSPDHGDALLALASLYYWNNNWEELLEAANNALGINPGDEDLLYKKALAQHMLGNDSISLATLDSLLLEDPDNKLFLDLRKQVLIDYPGKELFVRYFYDHFSQPYVRNWHMLTAGVDYPVSRGIISPYLNMGHFADTGSNFIATTAFQLNVDAYLNITPKNQILLGYGIGTPEYFPLHRAVVHLWQSLPSAWSVSAGARYFYFNEHYIFYALGVDKYIGNYWFDLKNYIFNKDYGWSLASYLTLRRYMETKYDYISATLGYGTSPDEPITSITDLQRLNAISVQLSIMRQVSGNIRLSAGVTYLYEEFFLQEYRHRINLQAAFHYKIR